MLQGERTRVQMVREHVRIVPWENDYKFLTTADFVFRNRGPATTVQMGFPEYRYGDVAEGVRPTMDHFQSWVDGCPVSVKRHVIRDDTNRALWVKTVHFGRNQTRRVRVRYISWNGGGDSSGNNWVSYQFTGGNWYGEVEESLLDLKLPPHAYALSLSQGIKTTDTSRWQSESLLRFRWTHWQAQKDFEFYYRPLFPSDFIPHSSDFLLSPQARPIYSSSGHDVLPWMFSPPEAILQKGRLWVAARRFGARWSEKQHGVYLCFNRKILFVSATGATRRSSLWPLAPSGTFWLASAGSNELMVPAHQLAKSFGGRFELDLKRGRAIWVQGKSRLTLNGI